MKGACYSLSVWNILSESQGPWLMRSAGQRSLFYGTCAKSCKTASFHPAGPIPGA
jgi:hypothetical protein